MKFTITKQDFLNVLQKVANVATSKTMPILATLLLEAKENKLKVSGTDLDLGIICETKTEVKEEGALAVPAKRLVDIIRSLPEGDINIASTKNNSLTINTLSCNFRISSLSAEDFPKMPTFESEISIKIKQGELQHLFDLTSFTVSRDETCYTLNGILFNINNNLLTLVSTDGKRLAIIKHELQEVFKEEKTLILPLKAVIEIGKNLNSDEEIKISFGKNQMLCSFKNMQIMSRLIEGEFPNWKQVVPEVSVNKVSIKRGLFLSAVIRASLLATENYQALKMSVFKDKIIISKETPDIGEMKEEVEASYNGVETAIGFKPEYLIEVLKAMGDDKIELELTDVEKPGVIRSGNYIHVLLPMRI